MDRQGVIRQSSFDSKALVFNGIGPALVPLAGMADFDNTAGASSVELLTSDDIGDYVYHNVVVCPDCSAGMIRQGRCCVCPSCGFETCCC